MRSFLSLILFHSHSPASSFFYAAAVAAAERVKESVSIILVPVRPAPRYIEFSEAVSATTNLRAITDAPRLIPSSLLFCRSVYIYIYVLKAYVCIYTPRTKIVWYYIILLIIHMNLIIQIRWWLFFLFSPLSAPHRHLYTI